MDRAKLSENRYVGMAFRRGLSTAFMVFLFLKLSGSPYAKFMSSLVVVHFRRDFLLSVGRAAIAKVKPTRRNTKGGKKKYGGRKTGKEKVKITGTLPFVSQRARIEEANGDEPAARNGS